MNRYFIIMLIIVILGIGCNKKKFLETNPSGDLSTIKTLADCQKLLNNETIFIETPALGEISSDNYYAAAGLWSSLNQQDKNAYLWEKDIFQGQSNIPDYNTPYSQVNISNEVLAALDRIIVTDNDKAQ